MWNPAARADAFDATRDAFRRLVMRVRGGAPQIHESEPTPQRVLHEALAVIPSLFANARGRTGRADGNVTLTQEPASVRLSRFETERRELEVSLAAISRGLTECTSALAQCSALDPRQKDRIERAVDTLRIEHTRLDDAGRFYLQRLARQAATGEEDDDPEFTQVLERVLHASEEDDEVECSVRMAVEIAVEAWSRRPRHLPPLR